MIAISSSDVVAADFFYIQSRLTRGCGPHLVAFPPAYSRAVIPPMKIAPTFLGPRPLRRLHGRVFASGFRRGESSDCASGINPSCGFVSSARLLPRPLPDPQVPIFDIFPVRIEAHFLHLRTAGNSASAPRAIAIRDRRIADLVPAAEQSAFAREHFLGN